MCGGNIWQSSFQFTFLPHVTKETFTNLKCCPYIVFRLQRQWRHILHLGDDRRKLGLFGSIMLNYYIYQSCTTMIQLITNRIKYRLVVNIKKLILIWYIFKIDTNTKSYVSGCNVYMKRNDLRDDGFLRSMAQLIDTDTKLLNVDIYVYFFITIYVLNTRR